MAAAFASRAALNPSRGLTSVESSVPRLTSWYAITRYFVVRQSIANTSHGSSQRRHQRRGGIARCGQLTPHDHGVATDVLLNRVPHRQFAESHRCRLDCRALRFRVSVVPSRPEEPKT